MTRGEFEKRKSQSDSFMRLIASTDWSIIDDLLVDIEKQTRDLKIVDVPDNALSKVKDLAMGRLECIAMIRESMSQWIQDRNLDPQDIDPEDIALLEDSES